MPILTCPRCGLTKDDTEFPPSTGVGNILRPRQCSMCRKEVDREKSLRYRAKYPDRRRLTQGNYDMRRPDRWRTDPEYRTRNLQSARRYKAKNREAITRQQRESYQKRRRAVLTLYGHRCDCCGETRLEFLAIDHRNGGGHSERRRLSASSLWTRLLRLGTPHPNYRVLCHNCNSAFGFYGYCPHQLVAQPGKQE